MSSKERRDCEHIVFIGELVSYTDSGCPRSELYMGSFVVTDRKCSNCRAYRKGRKEKKKYG